MFLLFALAIAIVPIAVCYFLLKNIVKTAVKEAIIEAHAEINCEE